MVLTVLSLRWEKHLVLRRSTVIFLRQVAPSRGRSITPADCSALVGALRVPAQRDSRLSVEGPSSMCREIALFHLGPWAPSFASVADSPPPRREVQGA